MKAKRTLRYVPPMLCPDCKDPDAEIEFGASVSVTCGYRRSGGAYVLNTCYDSMNWDVEDDAFCTACEWEGAVGDAEEAAEEANSEEGKTR